MSPSFSQRYGYEPLPKPMRLEELSSDLPYDIGAGQVLAVRNLPSMIARVVYQRVQCPPPPPTPRRRLFTLERAAPATHGGEEHGWTGPSSL